MEKSDGEYEGRKIPIHVERNTTYYGHIRNTKTKGSGARTKGIKKRTWGIKEVTMITKDKQLALQDLCARLPYGVIGEYSWKGNEPYNRELTGNLFDELKSSWDSTEDSQFLPYLRPMSSMTKEDKEELAAVLGVDYIDNKVVDFGEFLCEGSPINIEDVYGLLDWLNAHHFDYRGLINKGLAIEVTKENNLYDN